MLVDKLRKLNRPADRAGATVIEVMFAIFVVIVGLMGIASLLPLAARNADQSNASNISLTQGRIWEADFVAMGLNDHQSLTRKGTGFNWAVYNDTVGALAGFVPLVKASVPTLTNSRNAGSAQEGWTIWAQQSYCIDPMFFAQPEVTHRRSADANTNSNPEDRSRLVGYRAGNFPYFGEGQSPVLDPYEATPTNLWHDQPRMSRVSLQGASGIITSALAKSLFASYDQLAIFIDEDNKSNNPTARAFQGGSLKSASTLEYSWMATVSPEFNGIPSATTLTNDYVLSVVIFRRRDIAYVGTGTPIIGSPEIKPKGERIVWVYPLSGDFINGNGGRVRLMCNAGVDNSLHVGDWIMLGQHYAADTSTAPVQRFPVFRWFRIVAMNQEPTLTTLGAVSPIQVAGTGVDPYGNSSAAVVWSRDVVLEGPDWHFNGAGAGGVPAIPTTAIVGPTTGTLVSNVVTVIERIVTIPDDS